MIYLIMGVTGCGKTTIGRLLSKTLNIPFYDADDFHPLSNINKMKNGTPLTDNDRYPWFNILAENIIKWEKNNGAVLACSCLKEKYRKILKETGVKIQIIFLKGDKELIYERIKNRDHFMPPDLLQSQFEILEKPFNAITVKVNQNPNKIVEEIIERIE